MTLSPESLREDIQEIRIQLNEIQRMVSTIAVQDERLKHVEMSVNTLGRKHDLCAGTLVDVQKHQASCPREQLRWVWVVLIPQGLTLLGLLLGMLAQFFHGNK